MSKFLRSGTIQSAKNDYGKSLADKQFSAHLASDTESLAATGGAVAVTDNSIHLEAELEYRTSEFTTASIWNSI